MDDALETPLINLQPVANAQHAWVAMLLHAPVDPPAATLGHLFDELGLADALDGLPCVVPGAAAPASAAERLRRMTAATYDAEAERIAPPPASGADEPSLALGVNGYAAFDTCKTAGYAWFAGTYALHPAPDNAPRDTARHAMVLQLLTLITHDADTREIEDLIKRDAQLSYQLLRLVNSVAFSPGKKITSFGQAITMLGRLQLQRWLQLLLYARPAGAGPSALLPRAAYRAAFMEALFPPKLAERAFMAGMFSLLDVMLRERMGRIVAPLHLAEDISKALLERGGPLGPALIAIENAERADHDALAASLGEAGIDIPTWTGAMIRACHWTVRVSHEA